MELGILLAVIQISLQNCRGRTAGTWRRIEPRLGRTDPTEHDRLVSVALSHLSIASHSDCQTMMVPLQQYHFNENGAPTPRHRGHAAPILLDGNT